MSDYLALAATMWYNAQRGNVIHSINVKEGVIPMQKTVPVE